MDDRKVKDMHKKAVKSLAGYQAIAKRLLDELRDFVQEGSSTWGAIGDMHFEFQRAAAKLPALDRKAVADFSKKVEALGKLIAGQDEGY
ncbi:MAG TPA: hypothetical protein PKD10_17620 [Paracoccaceae bacterium]|nr:hypothetical protein [Paracoccaceae bacterium]